MSADITTPAIAAADLLGDAGLDYRVEVISTDGSTRITLTSHGYVAPPVDDEDDDEDDR